MAATNQYVIVRTDLSIDPITIISDGVLIGRLPECEVLLNHPSVSRVQAGIKQVENAYHLFPLRPRNPVLLNGKPVEENEALASGDDIAVGPFHLEIEIGEQGLLIRVELRIGVGPSEIDVSDAGLSTAQLVMPDAAKAKKPRAAPVASTKALDIFWDKRMREVAKMVRPSPLFPRARLRAGKAQSNWTATTDLASRWPVSYFVWGFLVVGLISIAGAYVYTQAYAPAPLSTAHTVDQLRVTPAIAASANAGSCTSCHSWQGNMEQRCASCHKTDAFVATVIKPHEAAGIGCIDCHAEHKGADFSAKAGALASCTACHVDGNSTLYNGKRVGTPHGGTFGYPVVKGQWSAKSINDEEWELRKLPVVRLATDSDQKWRSNQFHALHDQRVKVVAGIKGNSEGRLSCNSCHNSFDPIDRETPRKTCAACHNEGNKELGKPNCTSCHVQHILDKRRWSATMLAGLAAK
ncbi:MAG TPA: FHA domain-containing protein [Pyrinomonadaceae bacterium]|nr:FHA domain-containing protein [Pyrinomonadaceae bacterium]